MITEPRLPSSSSLPGHARRGLTRLTCGGLIATAAATCLAGTSSLAGASSVLAKAPTGGWARVASPNSGSSWLLAVSSTSATDLWTVGWHQGDSNEQTFAEHSADGTSWAIVPSENISTTTDNVLAGVAAVSASDVWAVGSSYDTTSAVYQPLIQHRTGSAGFITVASATLGTSVSQQLLSVYASSASDVWAVGMTYTGAYLQHFDGVTWTIVPSAGGDSLTSVNGTGPADIWAVGYKAANSVPIPFAEHWNGTAWSVSATPPQPKSTAFSYFEAVTAITPADVWAVGLGDKSGVNRTLTEHWNGIRWSIVASPNIGIQSNELRATSATSSTDVWSVGVATSNPPQTDQSLAMHWNGTAWSLASPPNACTTQAVDIYGVASITSADVWAVGNTACPTNATWATLIFNRK